MINEYLLSFVVCRSSFVVIPTAYQSVLCILYSVSVAVSILYSVSVAVCTLYSVSVAVCILYSVRRNAGLTSQRFSHTSPRIDPVRLFVPVYPSIYSGIVE